MLEVSTANGVLQVNIKKGVKILSGERRLKVIASFLLGVTVCACIPVINKNISTANIDVTFKLFIIFFVKCNRDFYIWFGQFGRFAGSVYCEWSVAGEYQEGG